MRGVAWTATLRNDLAGRRSLGVFAPVTVILIHRNSQLKAYLAYAQGRGFTFNLYIRLDTELNSPVAELGASGTINIMRLPGM